MWFEKLKWLKWDIYIKKHDKLYFIILNVYVKIPLILLGSRLVKAAL